MSRLACAAVSTGAETFSEFELSINWNSLNVSARALIRNKGKLLRVVVVVVVVVVIRRNQKKEEERIILSLRASRRPGPRVHRSLLKGF